MAATTIEALGAYKVHPDATAYRQALECRGDQQAVEDELSSVALVELLICDAPTQFSLSEFSHGPFAQAPYDAVYFDRDQDEVIARNFDHPNRPDFRVCFFLHFYYPTDKLCTPYGDVELPAIVPMPLRLQVLHYNYYD